MKKVCGSKYEGCPGDCFSCRPGSETSSWAPVITMILVAVVLFLIVIS